MHPHTVDGQRCDAGTRVASRLMAPTSRQRLVSLVRRPDADLAEAALLVCAEAQPDLDVDAALLRIDALADGLRTRGFRATPPGDAAAMLADHLAVQHGFTGDGETYHDPDNSLLTSVLDRRRGLPITLSILYSSIGRRLSLPTFPIALPGHVVTGVAAEDRPIVLDPFHDGTMLNEPTLSARVDAATGGRHAYRRSMLRPTPSVTIVRRLLSNLVRDLTAADRHDDARWANELRLLLPNRLPSDHRTHGEVLLRLGRFDDAAAAFEAYLEVTSQDAPYRDAARSAAIAARARMN